MLEICSFPPASKDQLKDAWEQFESSIRLPFAYSRRTFNASCMQHSDVAAVERPRRGLGVIRVHPQKFFALPDGRRLLTLLHESLHLAAITGPLAGIYDVTIELDRDMDRESQQLSFELIQNGIEMNEQRRQMVAHRTG